MRGWPTHPFPQEQPRLFWTRPWDLAFGHQDVGPHTALVGRSHSLFDRRQLRAHSQAALGRRGRWERLRLTLSCWKRRSPPGPARGHYKTSFILHELGGVPRGRQMEASVKNLCSAVSKTSISHGVPGHSAGRLLHAPVSHLKPESALPHPRQQGRGFAVTLGTGSIGPAPRAWLRLDSACCHPGLVEGSDDKGARATLAQARTGSERARSNSCRGDVHGHWRCPRSRLCSCGAEGDQGRGAECGGPPGGAVPLCVT